MITTHEDPHPLLLVIVSEHSNDDVNKQTSKESDDSTEPELTVAHRITTPHTPSALSLQRHERHHGARHIRAGQRERGDEEQDVHEEDVVEVRCGDVGNHQQQHAILERVQHPEDEVTHEVAIAVLRSVDGHELDAHALHDGKQQEVHELSSRVDGGVV